MIETTYIDHMGSDLSVVNAARVSFGKKSEMVCSDHQIGTYDLKEGDKRLIRYLAKHKHLSPFGHAFASFHVKAPIFVARQLVKHKFLRWNEITAGMWMMNLSSICLKYGVDVVLIRSRGLMVSLT